jgi:signal transduction histidine kinase
VYAPLLARDQLIGLIAGEIHRSDWAQDPEAALLGPIDEVASQLAGPAAVAIDNARWFGRIRSVAADDERVRIARDLHDRIGQSLALLGFEVDRITRTTNDPAIRSELSTLRSQVTDATQEVREALYDLRTDVSAETNIHEVLQTFLERVAQRSGIETELRSEGGGALPLRVSRELWHIAQEAIVNAERHAQCSHLSVRWRVDGPAAELDITDNGVGFAPGSGRADSYGLRGLRERAAGIGARVDVRSEIGNGTTVTVRLTDAT